MDASDSERLEEVGYELDALIAQKIVQDLPIALLFNKCDLSEAMSSEEICQRIQYSDLVKMQGEENMAIFRISVLRGEGYQEAFRWISKFL